jgi:hypothetical protein
MSQLDEQIRDHYLQQSLPERNLQGILTGEEPVRSDAWRRLLPLAAALAALLVAAFFLWKPADLTDAVVAEIAKNHNKQLAMEIKSGNHLEVQTKLDRIPFSLKLPEKEVLSEFTLVGGRYCSIQTELAAQLRLSDNDTGAPCTLYITKLTDSLGQLKPTTRTLKGVKVKLWSDDHRFFGLAVPSSGRE